MKYSKHVTIEETERFYNQVRHLPQNLQAEVVEAVNLICESLMHYENRRLYAIAIPEDVHFPNGFSKDDVAIRAYRLDNELRLLLTIFEEEYSNQKFIKLYSIVRPDSYSKEYQYIIDNIFEQILVLR